jgi:16S rRNA G966 N2-methylase RsmD
VFGHARPRVFDLVSGSSEFSCESLLRVGKKFLFQEIDFSNQQVQLRQ